MADKRKPRKDSGDVVLMVGTVKGAFLARSRRGRGAWEVSGPHFPGRSVYAMAYDGRAGRQRFWAAVSSMHWGALLHSSDDFGRTWTAPREGNVRFPAPTGAALKQIWQIQLGPDPDTLYCGVEPAALFQSKDAGATWSLVEGLWNHPHRPKWTPGGGGLCLHTILPDPQDSKRLLIATSTGGVYRTDDGGVTWSAQNKGIRTPFLAEKYPEFGQCVHKMTRHPSRPSRLFLQHHFGVYRSDDTGGSWKDVGKGLPSDFGFPIAVHPHQPDTIFVLPLKADEFRFPPEGKLRVFRSKTGGGSWQALSRGLPQKGCYDAVMRDGLAVDSLRPLGIYFGTRGGKVYGTRNEGGAWSLIADGLPAVVCVKASPFSPAARRTR